MISGRASARDEKAPRATTGWREELLDGISMLIPFRLVIRSSNEAAEFFDEWKDF